MTRANIYIGTHLDGKKHITVVDSSAYPENMDLVGLLVALKNCKNISEVRDVIAEQDYSTPLDMDERTNATYNYFISKDSISVADSYAEYKKDDAIIHSTNKRKMNIGEIKCKSCGKQMYFWDDKENTQKSDMCWSCSWKKSNEENTSY